MSKLSIFKESILSGAFIGLAGITYLSVGGIPGAVGFSLGLVLVCFYSSFLYTGKAGSYPTNDGVLNFLGTVFGLILIGNIVGCALIGYCASNCASPLASDSLSKIVENRESSQIFTTLIKSIMCGIIMDNIVRAYKLTNNPVPILLGVPAFILCGFYHSIADSFYYSFALFSGIQVGTGCLITWIVSIIGNFIGCNFKRILDYGDSY